MLQHFVSSKVYCIPDRVQFTNYNLINGDQHVSCQLVQFVLVLSTLLLIDAKPEGHAHSFQHFHGPVTGNEREVSWDDDEGNSHEDYVAHPHYAFSYGVEDHHTGDYHGQKEHRDGRFA